MTTINNVVVIGGGVAGLTASIYLGRSELRPIVIMGNMPGGQLTQTSSIENYPGFDEPINGFDLTMKIIKQAEHFNAEFIYDTVTGISILDNNSFEVKLESKNILLTKTILIATGTSHKKLDILGEAKFVNKGVSWCATCDGPIYKDKTVAVIGGGNTAVMEALFLTNFATEVFLIHRRESLRADKYEQEKLFINKKVKCIWNSEIISINGTTKVNNIEIQNNITKKTMIKSIDGVFIAIGAKPQTEFVTDLVMTDDAGYIIAPNTQTSCKGVFAAGDVVSDSLKQAVYAAGQGALAAVKIGKYLGIR